MHTPHQPARTIVRAGLFACLVVLGAEAVQFGILARRAKADGPSQTAQCGAYLFNHWEYNASGVPVKCVFWWSGDRCHASSNPMHNCDIVYPAIHRFVARSNSNPDGVCGGPPTPDPTSAAMAHKQTFVY